MQKENNRVVFAVGAGLSIAIFCFLAWLPNEAEQQDYLVEIPIEIPSGALETVDFDSMRNTPTVKITFDAFQQKNQEGAIGKVLYCIVDEPNQGYAHWSVYYFGFPTEFCGAVYQARIPWSCSTRVSEQSIFRKSFIAGAILKPPDHLEVKLSFAEVGSYIGVLFISVICGGITGLIAFGLLSLFSCIAVAYVRRKSKK